jgi:hypothetical protein
LTVLDAGRPSGRALPFATVSIALAWIALLVPVWVPAAPPTLDGPIHADIVRILLALERGDAAMAFFFRPSWAAEPNLSIYALWLGLAHVVPSRIAEKLILSLYLLALAAAAPVFLRIICGRWPRNPIAWCATAPFVFSAPFWFGFYNFVISLPLFVLTTALSLRFLERPSWKSGGALCLLSLVTYCTHVMSFAALGVAWVALLPWIVCTRFDRAAWLRSFAVRVAGAALVFAPTLLLLAVFLWRNRGQNLTYSGRAEGLFERIQALTTLSSLFATSLAEGAVVALLLVLLAVAALPALKKVRPQPVDALPIAALLLALAALSVPDRLFGGGYTAIRIQLYPYLLFALWLAARAPAIWLDRRQRGLGEAAAALLLMLAWIDTHAAMRMSTQVEAVVRATSALPPGKSILPVVFHPNGRDADGAKLARGIPFLMNVASRVAVARDAANLRMHQANTLNFPIHYRHDANPYDAMPILHRALWKDSILATDLDGLRGEIESYGRVDAVLAVGLDPTMDADPRLAALLRELAGWRMRSDRTLPGTILFTRE